MSSRLFKRELGDGGPCSTFKRHCARQRFSNFDQQRVHDTHDPDVANLKLSFLRRRSKVVEIVAAGDIAFALTLSGVCAAFSGSKRIAFLNSSPDEVIRSLYFNKANDSLVTVSVYRADNFSSLRCRSTPIDYIRRGRAADGFPIFESESLKWPGFVEFDDVNSKVLTYSAESKAYRVWEMTNYEPLFSVPDDGVTEIKISPGILLLIHQRHTTGYVPLRILSIDNGTVLKQFNHLLIRTKKVDFIEQFNEKLLVKQEGENLNIVDVHSGSVISVSRTEFVTPSAFIFLYENHLFLTFRGRQVLVWNFKGEQVTAFEDHELWHAETNTSNIFITAKQDYIISYCRPNRGGRDRLTRGDGSAGVGSSIGSSTGSSTGSSCTSGASSEADGGSSSDGGSSGASSGGAGTGTGSSADADEPERTSRGSGSTVLVAPSQARERQPLSAPTTGAIHVSHIRTGRCVARLASCVDGGCAHAHVLRDVSALYFSEERNELYVGDRNGLLHVYSQ